jgi:hypothetical protein
LIAINPTPTHEIGEFLKIFDENPAPTRIYKLKNALKNAMARHPGRLDR